MALRAEKRWQWLAPEGGSGNAEIQKTFFEIKQITFGGGFDFEGEQPGGW